MNEKILFIKGHLEYEGSILDRNHGMTKEIISFHDDFNSIEFNDFRKKEYDEYYDMIKNQIPVVLKEFNSNRYSRRLLFQFDRNYYLNRDEDFLICPESFIIFFISDCEYELVINFRSTDINRLEEDISIIKHISLSIFEDYSIKVIRCHICNLHMYIK